MLEQMRDSSGSVIIWVLFAIIIAAFVLFFGSPSDKLGCGANKEYSIEVDGKEVSVNSWRFAYNGLSIISRNPPPADQRRPLALELLLQREILAQEAEKLDFKVSTALVNEAIQGGDLYVLGQRLDGTGAYFNTEDPEAPFFDYQYLENLVRGRFGLPNVDSYKKEQRREILAHIMKSELIESAYVSEEEARQNFVMANTTVSAEYVKFEVSKYRSSVKLSEKDVQSYVDANADKLKNEWEQVKPRWEGDKERVRARIIKVARTIPAAAKPAATEGEEAEKAAEPPAAAQVDPARSIIDGLRARIVGGEAFSEVAKAASQDQSASLGGNIGWRAADSMGFGPEVVEASKGLDVGKVSEVIEGASNYYLVVIEERSAKGLSFEQKKFDLALTLAPDTVARDLAKAAAERALAQAATTPLSELFVPATPSSPSGIDLNNLPPEILEQLTPEQLEKLMNSAVPNSESGALYRQGPTQLAQLGGDAPAKPAKPVEEKTVSPEPATKPVEAKKPAVADSASLEALAPAIIPAVGESEDTVPAPALQKVVGTTRNGDFIAGLGRSQELVSDLFGVLAIDSMGPKVYSVTDSDGFVLVKLTDRSEADMERFKTEARDLQAALAEAKGGELLNRWVAKKCLKLKKAGAIKANATLLVTGSDNKAIPYEPCSYLTPGN